MKKGTKFYSIVKGRCPHCHEGEFFVSHPYNFKHVGQTPRHCPTCERRLLLEPGFYYGAMYVSYGLGVGLFVACWIAVTVLAPDAHMFTTAGIVSALMLLLGPAIYHLSKIIWANMFIKYKGPAGAGEDEAPTKKSQPAAQV